MLHPYLYFDVLYIHDKPSSENKLQEIYDFLTAVERKDENTYYCENSTNIKRCAQHFGMLLAHPLQRTAMDKVKTNLGEPSASVMSSFKN